MRGAEEFVQGELCFAEAAAGDEHAKAFRAGEDLPLRFFEREFRAADHECGESSCG